MLETLASKERPVFARAGGVLNQFRSNSALGEALRQRPTGATRFNLQF